jgi:hypothetical protein
LFLQTIDVGEGTERWEGPVSRCENSVCRAPAVWEWGGQGENRPAGWRICLGCEHEAGDEGAGATPIDPDPFSPGRKRLDLLKRLRFTYRA